MNLERAKGTKDYPPEEKIARQEVIDKLRAIFELYGFSPLETPIIERFDVLSAKYAGGAEILKETFKFKDQGDKFKDAIQKISDGPSFQRRANKNRTAKRILAV